jgi:filamentous hemagglutinin family protein
MHHTLNTSLLLTTFTVSQIAFAEVVLDGTLGTTGSLPGPHFAIEAHLGHQLDGNLFHSFQDFNLNSHESATFSGANNIGNIISRVTGGNPSNIDGLIRSTIPNANLYFLNPDGIMFGENAKLDVQGSFHASTADYLRLGTDGRFDASQPNKSLLTVAPPSAFGFLDNSPASISKQQSFLAVPEGKTLSFIGGDLTLQDDHLIGRESSMLRAFDGQVNLVSVASKGEVPIEPRNLSDNAFRQLGTIRITNTPITIDDLVSGDNGVNIDVSGNGGGGVYIVGEQIFMENAYVFADTQGTQNGQSITIKAANELVAKGSIITTEAMENSTGNAGNINVAAKQITLSDGTQIASTSRSSGAAGNIIVTANKAVNLSGSFTLFYQGQPIELKSGLSSNTVGTGKGGQITVTTPALILANGSLLTADTQGFGDAGNISLQVDKLILKEGAQINVNAGSQQATKGRGHGGTLTVTAKQAILITGEGSALLSNTFTEGEGGTIVISAPLLEILDKGIIQAGTELKGKGGFISVDVDTLDIRQQGTISTETRLNGLGGNIELQANHINLTEGGTITTSSLGTAVSKAGNMRLHVKESLKMQNGSIKTETINADGGNIHITSPGYLYLINGTITTTVKAIDGNGGNISLTPEFLVLENSRIKADASQGNGGNIQLTTTGIYNFSGEPIEEIITASSELGVDGEIAIDSPEMNLDEFLILPGTFLDISNFMGRCASPRDNYRFTITIADVLPSFSDWLNSPSFYFGDE